VPGPFDSGPKVARETEWKSHWCAVAPTYQRNIGYPKAT
jgi:hypothetical protein